MTHEELEEAVPLYAIGALERSERQAIEAHLLSGCSACHAALKDYQTVASLLPQEGLAAAASVPTFHDDLVRESVRLSRLVENVLAVSQLEEGRRVLDLRAGDLAAHLREVVAGQARHVASKGFPPVVLELPDDLVIVRFDRQAIEQITVNLLDNALKYAADGPDRELLVRLELAPDRAVIHVADRGPGVHESERERVFGRFVRVQRPSTAHTPGTGLGLSGDHRPACIAPARTDRRSDPACPCLAGAKHARAGQDGERVRA